MNFLFSFFSVIWLHWY